MTDFGSLVDDFRVLRINQKTKKNGDLVISSPIGKD
jgi:hypothetical protein